MKGRSIQALAQIEAEDDGVSGGVGLVSLYNTLEVILH